MRSSPRPLRYAGFIEDGDDLACGPRLVRVLTRGRYLDLRSIEKPTACSDASREVDSDKTLAAARFPYERRRFLEG